MSTKIGYLLLSCALVIYILLGGVSSYQAEVKRVNGATIEPRITTEEHKFNVPLSDDLIAYVLDASYRYEIDAKIIFAIIEQESNFNPNADNGYCVGLMQISRDNFGWLHNATGIKDLFNPKDNIEAGCYILSQHLKSHTLEQALVCYNVGHCSADSTWYSRSVLARAEKY